MSHDDNHDSYFAEHGLTPTTPPKQYLPVDLEALRLSIDMILLNTSRDTVVLAPEVVLAVIERAQAAEAFTKIHECYTQLDFVSGKWWCLLHDTTFDLNESCYYAGKSIIQQLEGAIAEQHASEQEAETRITAVHTLLNGWEQSNSLDARLLQEIRLALHGVGQGGAA